MEAGTKVKHKLSEIEYMVIGKDMAQDRKYEPIVCRRWDDLNKRYETEHFASIELEIVKEKK